MCGVKSPASRALPPAVRRWRVLCVLGLLVGLLGMHGLAPGGATAQQHMPQPRVSQTHAQAVPSGHTGDGAEAQDGCAQGGHCGGGHVQHADATCASGAVGGGPVLPALVADPVPGCVPEDAVRALAAVAPEGARAPPDLAELQLLRI
ncbi:MULTISPECIES: DUF6153 family protein [unclassified Streptomyces]|uniref:DUF6153 family protein n=1 Tax=unclassified Streptomyces TaxID=2593676 RepID=UPI0004C267BF|nr:MULTISPECIES: DUF6153 family protein [unclassified Streptomyces]